MASVSNHSLFVTCLSTTHTLLKKHTQLRTHFENSYREHLCNFNFEQYIASNCVIPLSKQVEALKNACIDTRQYIGECLERGVDSGLHDIFLSIYHQIWTPFSSATLAQLSKTVSNNKKLAKSKVTTPAANDPVLPDLPQNQVDSVCDELWTLATSGEPLYPKLCAKKNCSACCELLFDLPLSKCSVDCAHKKLTNGVYPHLGRKFMDKLKPHHGQTPVKVKQSFRPDTWVNPMYDAELPSYAEPTTRELEQGVERLEICSSTSAATSSSQSTKAPAGQAAADATRDGVSNQSLIRTKAWVDIVEEGSSSGDLQSDAPSSKQGSPRKRTSRSIECDSEVERAHSPRKQGPLRRSSRIATAKQ